MLYNVLRYPVFSVGDPSRAGLSSSKSFTNDEYVSCIYSAIRQAWPVLENIWDTHVYRTLRLVVADDCNAWAVDSKSLARIPYSEIQQRRLPVECMYYKEIKWTDARPTIYVSLGVTLPPEEKARFQSEKKPVPVLFNVATHEAFHMFVQNVWEKTAPENNSRTTPYPVQVLPRFYRNSIIRALYATLQGRLNALGHVRYWFELWKKMYPDDVRKIRQYDIDEGSARYIEIAAQIIAQGERFNSMQFRKAFVEEMRDDAGHIYTSADSESYVIGALSGLILNDKNVKWQPRVVRGIPPLDILLESIPSITQQADREIEAEIKSEVSKINLSVGRKISEFAEAFHSSENLKLFVNSALSGSYSISGGFFRTKLISYDLMVGLSSSASWSDGSYNIVDVVAAAVDNSPEFRGKSGFLILYSGVLPPIEKGRLIIKTEKLSLDITYPNNTMKSKTIFLP